MKSLRTFIQIHRRIKQHATLFSLVVVVMLFGLFLEAYMHDFNLVYITLFFVFSFAFSAGPIGVLNLGKLEASYGRQGRFFAKEESQIRFKIKNTHSVTSWAILLYGRDKSKIELPYIKSQSEVSVTLPLTLEKRGKFSYEGAYFESKYPLSTARLTLSVDEKYEGLAYPEPKGIPLSSYISQQETFMGEEKEFDGLHTYDGTQKISHLHWSSIAKGEMSVKKFSKETKINNLNFIFLNIKGDIETRLSQLTLWVLECEKLRLKFEITLPKRRLNSQKESIDEILEILARY